MCEADDPIASGLHRGIACPISLESSAMTVVGKAIGLDHKFLPRPVGVDLIAQDFDIGRGRRQVVLATEGENLILETGPSSLRVPTCVDQTTNHREGSPAVTARADSLKIPQAQQPQPIRLLERTLETIFG
jgi:hypothetical protein